MKKKDYTEKQNHSFTNFTKPFNPKKLSVIQL